MNTDGHDQSSLPAGWPDVESLTRLANEFFSALPGHVQPGSPKDSQIETAVTSPKHLIPEAMPRGPYPSAVELLGEAELRKLFASSSSMLSRSEDLEQLPDVAAEPSFYFVRDTQPVEPGVRVPGFEERKPDWDRGFSGRPFDVNLIRRDFPILEERVHGKRLVWLDNAATTHKPRAVIDRLRYFYEHENSNVHRAAHEMAARATDAYEAAREKVRRFLNAASENEVVFVRGATEAINLVAQSWGRQNIGKDDEIIVSWLEHHANIVPWQQLANEKAARLRVIPVDDTGQIRLEEYGKLLGSKTKLVSITQVSNALGTITPVRQVVEMAHAIGAKVLIDGAQAVSHMRVDVKTLNSDWYVFSGHKIFGPTGIGVLYGKEALLNESPPCKVAAT